MDKQAINEIIAKQRAFFDGGATFPISFRIESLKRLRKTILRYEKDIAVALQEDLGKSEFESYMCETGLVLSEIGYMIKHIRTFSKAKKVRTPLSQFAAKTYRKVCPRGNVLIVSPWNYPFLLTIEPLVDAIAAGNTAVIKPSAYSPFTSALMAKMLSECFSPEYVAVVTGGREENATLFASPFDFIFFTGSQSVGKEVMKKAADRLIPVLLELGGKSPCIVDKSANIPLTAKRIVFGKFLNCGQTCVAPDYILCDESVQERLKKELHKQIEAQFGKKSLQNPDYGKIVNEKHFRRLCGLIDENKKYYGGGIDEKTLRIEPTILEGVTWDDPVMREEIFGPILPILTFRKEEDIFTLLRGKQKPLALYLFSENKAFISAVTEKIPYGGGCINDCVIHLATSETGFGGVGESGMGSYHGKDGFFAFSHVKSIVDKKTCIDLPVRYQPYGEKKKKWLKRFLK